MRKASVFLLALAVATSCSHKQKKSEAERIKRSQERQVQWVNQIQLYIEESKFEKSLEDSRTFLVGNFASKHSQLVRFYEARSLEGLKNWEESLSIYREINRNPLTPQDILAQSLYRQSFVYEALGQDEKVIATLLDLKRAEPNRKDELHLAELPARLATVYARMGNGKLANQYYAEAEKGIKALKASRPENEINKWLPKTLYYMGNMSIREFNTDNFENSIVPLQRAQEYLLKSVIMGDDLWSKRATAEIQKIYTDLIKLIETLPAPTNEDEEVALKEQQSRKWRMATLTLESLKKLRLAWDSRPDMEDLEDKEIVAFLSQKETDLGKILEENPVAVSPTKEVKERQGLKRKARVQNPDPALEEQALKRSKP